MKTKEIIALLKDGKKPLVKLTGHLWDDSWGEKGMITRILSYKENPHDGEEIMIELSFDFNEYKIHNLSLQSHNYYLNILNNPSKLGTAFEAGMMKEDNIHEGVYFMLENNGSDVPCELFNSPVAEEYLKSNSILPYVEWLEREYTVAKGMKAALEEMIDKG